MLEIKSNKNQIQVTLNGSAQEVHCETAAAIAATLSDLSARMSESGLSDQECTREIATILNNAFAMYGDMLARKKLEHAYRDQNIVRADFSNPENFL